MYAGAGMLYCGCIVFCCMSSMFGVSSTTGALKEIVEDWKSHVEKGMELSVSIDSISPQSSLCAASTCMVKSFDTWDESTESWTKTEHTSCKQTDKNTITCYCEEFKIQARLPFGTFPSNECVYLEVEGG